jgi:nitrite reductase/ring-hydroxylating ferredoxin subunit
MASRGQIVARLEELADGTTKKFRIRCDGRELEAFLVGFEGRVFAYLNRCCHVPMSLDWVDNQFFSEDRRYLVCATHGATYEPSTGECVWGPCYGAFLERVPLEIRGNRVFAFCPSTKAQEP